MLKAYPLLKAILWYEDYDTPNKVAYNISTDPSLTQAYAKVLNSNNTMWIKARYIYHHVPYTLYVLKTLTH